MNEGLQPMPGEVPKDATPVQDTPELTLPDVIPDAAAKLQELEADYSDMTAPY